MADKDIVVRGLGSDWNGNIELSERAWEAFGTNGVFTPLASDGSTEIIDHYV
jgi:hypothetical protein